MSLAFKCDRCGATYEHYKTDDFNGIGAIRDDGIFLGKSHKTLCHTYDLCPKCYEKFKNWLYNYGTEEEATE